MSDGTWPTADERLVRRYRRLLLAYSRRYRRAHGTEMITTMLEMAGPGRSRPSAGESWHLVVSGVRQRFRLPSGRPFAVIAAGLVTLVLGLFGAAAGSRLGENGLPSRADALALMFGQHLGYDGPVYSLHSALRPGSHLDGVAPWLIPVCAVAAVAAGAVAAGIVVLGAGPEEPPGAAQPT
ncbi:hypothetical protein JIG36_34070 [Actinoplanes sp. LDG1-06]|uniref:Uncharacterized protein n=1 Tax=Paractinoplanes ovalisporus TaxID=2810368 RepID=A0ABS2AL76_9ACTN|nr:hypothetical protein [Actinoplanes ovalisporus]MBM2620540.1 hypothetical protein [Actinoplanes ovalisporus]